MNWRPILVTIARLTVLAMVAEIALIGTCWRWFWTPIERHYLPAYIRCSLPVITPATAEVRFVWKIGPHRKRELATDDDVEDSESGTAMALSQSALDAGWKTVMVGQPQEVPTARLGPALADFAYDGESLWRFLLLPETCGVVMFCFGLYGCFRFLNRILDWAADRSSKRSPWPEPSPTFVDGWAQIADKLCSGILALHRRAQHCKEPRRTAPDRTFAPSEPESTPPSFAFSIFGVHNGTGQGFLWREENEIE